MDLFDMLSELEAYPMEIENVLGESVAMGFISCWAAQQENYLDREESGRGKFVASILGDVTTDPENCIYEYQGLKIWLSR